MDDHPNVIWSVATIRRYIGCTALVFPVVLFVGYWFFEGPAFPDSISAYYYSHSMQNAFIGLVVVLGASLIYYQYQTIDNWVTTIAGLSAFGVVFFPTMPTDHTPTDWQQRVGYVHFACSALLLVALAYIALFLFTQTNEKVPSPQKLVRNNIYRVCGSLISLCLVLDLLVTINWVHVAIPHAVFWLETGALWAFGAAWIVKGEAVAFLNDPSIVVSPGAPPIAPPVAPIIAPPQTPPDVPPEASPGVPAIVWSIASVVVSVVVSLVVSRVAQRVRVKL
jgi:hypothetical protein